MSDDDKLLYCSFCGRSQKEVQKLIAGPSVFICNRCVDLCIDIVIEEANEATGELKDMPNLESLIKKAQDKGN